MSTTQKYRKCPVVVEARQVPSIPDGEFESWLGEAFETWLPSAEAVAFHVAKNGNREAVVHAGGWVIAEPDGEGFYPCTAAEFERVYEPADTRHLGAVPMDENDIQRYVTEAEEGYDISRLTEIGIACIDDPEAPCFLGHGGHPIHQPYYHDAKSLREALALILSFHARPDRPGASCHAGCHGRWPCDTYAEAQHMLDDTEMKCEHGHDMVWVESSPGPDEWRCPTCDRRAIEELKRRRRPR